MSTDEARSQVCDSTQADAGAEVSPCQPLALVHDVARCLALADQEKLAADAQGRLRPRSLVRLSAGLALAQIGSGGGRGARSPSVSFVLKLLGHAGCLASTEDAIRLTPTAHEWLAAPAWAQIAQLRESWWRAAEISSGWLPRARRDECLNTLADGHGLRTQNLAFWQALIVSLNTLADGHGLRTGPPQP